jgi:CRP-like cAMP-binding protein
MEKVDAKVINDIELLSYLTNEQIALFQELAEVKAYPKGSRLFQEGDKASTIFILFEGKVSIQVQLSSRPGSVAITVLENSGQLVGWSGLVGPSYYTASAVCLEDSNFLMIEGEAFTKILEMEPMVGFNVMQHVSLVISQRLRNIQSVVLKTL